MSFIPYLKATSTEKPPGGPKPPDNTNRSLSFVPGVVYDEPGLFKSFGDVITDVPVTVHRGMKAAAVFVGANPRNNLRLEQSYATVEMLVPAEGLMSSDGEATHELRPKEWTTERGPRRWRTVRDDSDWHLVFGWRRKSELLATSEVTVTWETESWAEPGVYRIRYFGDAKGLRGGVTSFEGCSGDFILI